MNPGHTCLLYGYIYVVLFSANQQNMVTLLHSPHRKYAFLVKTTEKSKPKTTFHKKRVSLELLHQILGHRSKMSLLDWDTANVCQDTEIRVDPDPFCISCKISTIKKQPRSKIPLNPKTPFNWVFLDIISDLSSKRLTKETTFTHDLLIVDAYSKLPRLYGMETITTGTEEVMEKLNIFQARFGKVDEFGWWYLKWIQTNAGTGLLLIWIITCFSVCIWRVDLGVPTDSVWKVIEGKIDIFWCVDMKLKIRTCTKYVLIM